MNTIETRVLSRKNTVRRSRNCGARSRGAVLMETALVFAGIVLPLTLAIIQFGMFYNATNALNHITRDAARFAAVYCIASDDKTTPDVDEGSDAFILQHIKDVTASNSLNWDDIKDSITISPADRASRAQYGQISVTISYDLNKRAFLFYKPGKITRTSVAMIE